MTGSQLWERRPALLAAGLSPLNEMLKAPDLWDPLQMGQKGQQQVFCCRVGGETGGLGLEGQKER